MARKASRTTFELPFTSSRGQLVRSRGFTIVELLIVVVVIAILAAITIVAFNGITSRTHDSAIKGDLSQFAKKIELFAAENSGSFPSSGAQLTSLQVRPSRGSYTVDEVNRGNLTLCSISSGANARYAISAKSKSGTVWTYRSSEGIGLYPDQAGYNGAHGTVCPALGFSGYFSAQGYQALQWGNPGWQPWVN